MGSSPTAHDFFSWLQEECHTHPAQNSCRLALGELWWELRLQFFDCSFPRIRKDLISARYLPWLFTWLFTWYLPWLLDLYFLKVNLSQQTVHNWKEGARQGRAQLWNGALKIMSPSWCLVKAFCLYAQDPTLCQRISALSLPRLEVSTPKFFYSIWR